MFTLNDDISSTISFNAPGLSFNVIKILTILPIFVNPLATICPKRYMSIFPPHRIGTTFLFGAGFLLNNEMDDFSSKPGEPNMFGLLGNEANAIEPKKRPLSSMTPTIVLKDDKPFLILGTPGGSTIITTVLQNFLNVVIHGMDIQQAVSSPRVHSQWMPDMVFHEKGGLSKSLIRKLSERGHDVKLRGNIGEANGIMINDQGFWGGPDSRGENTAIGY